MKKQLFKNFMAIILLSASFQAQAASASLADDVFQGVTTGTIATIAFVTADSDTAIRMIILATGAGCVGYCFAREFLDQGSENGRRAGLSSATMALACMICVRSTNPNIQFRIS